MSLIGRTVTGSIIAAGLSLTAYAIPYCGTITQIIEFTNDPSYNVGQTVNGLFQYDAQSVDGDFGTVQYCNFTNPSANPTLDGSVYGYLNSPESWFCFDISGFRNRTHLVVTDGSVSDFRTGGQQGGVDYGFGFSGFSISNFNAGTGQSFLTTGKLIFSSPVAVPEGAGTFFLLLIGTCGLSLFRRKVLRQ